MARSDYRIALIMNPEISGIPQLENFPVGLFHKKCESISPFLASIVELTFIDEMIAEHDLFCEAKNDE